MGAAIKTVEDALAEREQQAEVCETDEKNNETFIVTRM